MRCFYGGIPWRNTVLTGKPAVVDRRAFVIRGRQPAPGALEIAPQPRRQDLRVKAVDQGEARQHDLRRAARLQFAAQAQPLIQV